MKNFNGVFRNLEKMLKRANWFEEGWEIYNRGAYLQLYKKESWHHQNQGGIDFETYIEASQIKQKSFPVCMHAEEDCPSQSEFIQRFLEIEGDRINSWKGYQTVGKGYSICQLTLPINFKNLEQRLYEEFNQLRQLEPTIEQILWTL